MVKNRSCIGGLLLLIAAIWFFVNSILSFVIQYFQYSRIAGAGEALRFR